MIKQIVRECRKELEPKVRAVASVQVIKMVGPQQKAITLMVIRIAALRRLKAVK